MHTYIAKHSCANLQNVPTLKGIHTYNYYMHIRRSLYRVIIVNYIIIYVCLLIVSRLKVDSAESPSIVKVHV